MSLAPSLLIPQAANAPVQPPNGRPAPGQAPAAVDSTDILRGQKAVDISHNGALYRLQTTRLGKLILTK
ncbi:hemin uptake protein HemP [Polaromonas sp. YR568]|uniref:hemin uptake protein HemP n=1 Tax=Polaromonas sp. YR568 TaxID=1855301 RepID=UPI003137D6ED